MLMQINLSIDKVQIFVPIKIHIRKFVQTPRSIDKRPIADCNNFYRNGFILHKNFDVDRIVIDKS